MICHDVDAELAFKVTVKPIGASVQLSIVRDDYLDSVCTTINVFYKTYNTV